MRISQLMQGLRPSEQVPAANSEKTAADKQPAPTALNTALSAALTTATGVASTTKTAGELVPPAPISTPGQDLEKMASSIAATEKEASIKEAQILGTAFADAAVARFAAYQKVASQLPAAAPVAAPAKTAGVSDDPEFDKFASENPDAIQSAVKEGYAPNRVGLQKMAQDYYAQGFNDTVEHISKTAQVEFLKGASVTRVVIENTRKQAAARA